MRRLQNLLSIMTLVVMILIIPTVHVLALMNALPGGNYPAECGDTKNPGQK